MDEAETKIVFDKFHIVQHLHTATRGQTIVVIQFLEVKRNIKKL